MPNSPLLLNYLWFGARFFVKLSKRRVQSRILVEVCAVAIATGLVKNVFFVYFKIIQPLAFFHRLPTTNWHEIPSVNTALLKCWHTRSMFVIRRKSFSVVLKIPYVKIQIFRDRSSTWFLNCFLSKFLEILTTGLTLTLAKNRRPNH